MDQGGGRFVYESTRVAASRLDGRQQSALEYLFGTLACYQSPDLTPVLGENVHLHSAPVNTIGAHSEPTWLLQKIPLVFNGPGVPAGRTAHYPARLVDVAPTILALLGLPAEGMDGLVLSEALVESTPPMIDQQLNASETRRLIRYQESLAELARLPTAATGPVRSG